MMTASNLKIPIHLISSKKPCADEVMTIHYSYAEHSPMSVIPILMIIFMNGEDT